MSSYKLFEDEQISPECKPSRSTIAIFKIFLHFHRHIVFEMRFSERLAIERLNAIKRLNKSPPRNTKPSRSTIATSLGNLLHFSSFTSFGIHFSENLLMSDIRSLED
jgi:hypothetical protein